MAKYKVKNWSEYDKSIVQRDYITVWLSQEAIAQWSSNKPTKRDKPEKYSHIAMTYRSQTIPHYPAGE